MNGLWQPWRSLLPVWLPAVLLCIAAIATHVWLSSDSLGRAAQVRQGVAELEQSIDHLERIRDLASAEREGVAVLDDQLETLHTGVFGSLDQRLTAILRAVGGATHEAGLLPSRYAYSWDKEKVLGLIRFNVHFQVQGTYDQVRKLLAGLRSSPELLVVDKVSFRGEEGPVTRELSIGIGIATYLAEADIEQLELLGHGRRPAGSRE